MGPLKLLRCCSCSLARLVHYDSKIKNKMGEKRLNNNQHKKIPAAPPPFFVAFKNPLQASGTTHPFVRSEQGTHGGADDRTKALRAGACSAAPHASGC